MLLKLILSESRSYAAQREQHETDVPGKWKCRHLEISLNVIILCARHKNANCGRQSASSSTDLLVVGN